MRYEACLQLRVAAKRCGQLRQRPWQQRRRYKATRHRQGSCKKLSSSSSRIEKTHRHGRVQIDCGCFYGAGSALGVAEAQGGSRNRARWPAGPLESEEPRRTFLWAW